VSDELLRQIGQIALSSLATGGVIFAALRAYAAKWLDNRFAERLAVFKHAQAKEIEEVRFRINSIFDRLTKLHQKEFEVLPEAWAGLLDAFSKAEDCLSSYQSYPDLDRMSEAQRNDIIESCALREWQKEEILQAVDKTRRYQEHINPTTSVRLSQRLEERTSFYVICGFDGFGSVSILPVLLTLQVCAASLVR
jgi:hypothetical protein